MSITELPNDVSVPESERVQQVKDKLLADIEKHFGEDMIGGTITPEIEERERQIAEARKLSDEQLRVKVLEWLNDFRAEYGLAPLDALPKGRTGSTNECTLAEGLTGISDGSPTTEPPDPYQNCRYAPDGGAAYFVRNGQRQRRPIPVYVQEFIGRFDQGRYPDLIAPQTTFHPGPYVMIS